MVKFTKVDNLYKYLVGARLIGVGTTAYCFLMRDGYVIKVFKDTYHTRDLFYRLNMFSHLDKLSELSNEHYFGPKEVLIRGDVILAYLMDFVSGKTINKLSSRLTIKDMIESGKILEEDTFKVSEKRFRLSDLHNKNIMYNDCFNLIDLDNGYFTEIHTESEIQKYNMQDLFKQIIFSIFRVNDEYEIVFCDREIEELFKRVIYRDYHDYVDFLHMLAKRLGEPDVTLRELQKNKRKLLRTELHNDYKKFGLY